MDNTSPIFLNCFSRGGSNIFWNFFLSHPDVCSPINETLQIFGAGLTHRTVDGYLIALISGQWRLFDQWNFAQRRLINQVAQKWIDRTFYRWKLRTLNDSEMRLKQDGVLYTQHEIERARLCAKNNNGLVFLTEPLLQIYPDATFFGLTRHPVALYEGHKRHKVCRSPEHFASYYLKTTEKMLADSHNYPNYHLVKFEEVLEKPQLTLEKIYNWANLDINKVTKIRLKAKPHLDAHGQRTTSFQEGKHYWFALNELDSILDANINEYQNQQLSSGEIEIIKNLCRSQMSDLRYQ